MSTRATTWGLLALGLLSSCRASEHSDGPGFTVVDSAGIELVTNHAPRWGDGDGWRVSDQAVLKIGELDGPLEFTFGDVVAVGWLPDGRIFVGDEQDHTIRIFSPKGDYLLSVGGEGQGPGELQAFLIVSRYRGDSLWVHDYAQETVSVFSPGLTYARRFRNPVLEGNYWVTGSLTDGRFLLQSPGTSRPTGGLGLVPDTSLIIVSAPDGSSVDTVGAFVAATKRFGPGGRGQPLHLYPYGRAIVVGGRVIVTEGKDFEYWELEPDGTVRRIVRKEHKPVPVTDELIEDFKAYYLDWTSASPEAGSEWIRRSLEQAEYAPQLPAIYPDLKVDALGYLWIGRYHFVGALTQEWEVFDSTGVWLGSVDTPPGLEVHEIGVDQIIGVAKDDYDVPYVQVHRLSRR